MYAHYSLPSKVHARSRIPTRFAIIRRYHIIYTLCIVLLQLAGGGGLARRPYFIRLYTENGVNISCKCISYLPSRYRMIGSRRESRSTHRFRNTRFWPPYIIISCNETCVRGIFFSSDALVCFLKIRDIGTVDGEIFSKVHFTICRYVLNS